VRIEPITNFLDHGIAFLRLRALWVHFEFQEIHSHLQEPGEDKDSASENSGQPHQTIRGGLHFRQALSVGGTRKTSPQLHKFVELLRMSVQPLFSYRESSAVRFEYDRAERIESTVETSDFRQNLLLACWAHSFSSG
jgi:hypothetical protein